MSGDPGGRPPRAPCARYFPTPLTSAPVPAGTSFEADLRATRESADLSLGDIQQKTRIPVDVLRRFEEGELIGDPTYNEVYLKAFLQSYAKAVGVAPSAVLAAYEQQRAGAYGGTLHPDAEAMPAVETPIPGASAAPSVGGDPEPIPPADRPVADQPAAETPVAARPAESVPPRAAVPPAVQALSTAPAPSARPESRPKTLAQARVNRPVVPSAKRSFDKNWGTILGLFAVLVLALGGALYWLVFAGDADEPEPADTVAVGAESEPAAVDSSGIGTGAAAGGPQLQFPITAVVTATEGGDGLQWFRVTQDGDAQGLNWIDRGTSKTFQADSVLVLWGEGNQAGTAYAFEESAVEIQGIRFTPRNGAPLRLDRQRGQAVLDSLATAPRAPAPAPAASDTTIAE